MVKKSKESTLKALPLLLNKSKGFNFYIIEKFFILNIIQKLRKNIYLRRNTKEK